MSASQLFVLLYMEVRYLYIMFENCNIAFATVEIIQWSDRFDRSECIGLLLSLLSLTRVSFWPFPLIVLAIVLLRKLGRRSAMFVHFLHSLTTKWPMG